MEAILEDEVAVRRKAGVTPGPAPQAAAPSFFCSITLEDVPSAMGFALPCGHLFSQQAWRRLVHVSPQGDDIAAGEAARTQPFPPVLTDLRHGLNDD